MNTKRLPCHGVMSVCIVLSWMYLPAITSAFDDQQDMVDYLSQKLQIQFSVLTNMETADDGGPRAKASLQITNIGNRGVKETNWELYLCSIRMWEPDILKETPGATAKLGESGLQVSHVKGCLHRITAVPNSFKGFLQDLTLLVPFTTSDWLAAKTDVSPNWYVTAPGATARTLFYTAGESLAFVDDFTTPEQWKRREYDNYQPYKAQDRYKMRVKDTGQAQIPVIPTPHSYKVLSTLTVNLSLGSWEIIITEPSIRPAATLLSKRLFIPVSLMNARAPTPATHAIVLELGDVKDTGGKVLTSDVEEEAYHLSVDALTSLVTVRAPALAGILHGVQTLLSVAFPDNVVPEVEITDYPRYSYRGVHVDVARNFHPKSAILLLIDAMSMYKLNKLHLHLTDDEGWRLQVPGLRELTEVGGQRCHDLDEKQCILSQLGSGPDTDTSGSGFYSVEDYREILRYARDRAIEVIPEFDMPGHAHAAIKAMESRYHRLLPLGDAPARQFLLSDPDDESEYLSIQYFRDNAVNPCLTSTYNFISKLVHEVAAMHADIQPLKTFHFGGDEVPEGAWTKSPACEGGPGASELKQTFVEQVARIVQGEGLGLAGWEDGLMLNTSTPYPRDSINNPEVIGYAWNNIWEWGGGSRAYVLANNDYKVVLSHATTFYFDHPSEPDPEERGLYWASRYTDVRDVLAYTPGDVYANIRADLWGKPLLRENVCRAMGCVELEEGKEKNIIGIQGQLWSETVRTSSQMFGMLFPRLLALAERAWHRAQWEDEEEASGVRTTARDEEWKDFSNTLGYKELRRLDSIGVEYRLPCPGAIISHDGLLHTSTSFPGLMVEYSIDGAVTWNSTSSSSTSSTSSSSSSSEGKVQVPYDTKVLLRTRSPNGKRLSRVVSVSSPKSLPPSAGNPTVATPPSSAVAPGTGSLNTILLISLPLLFDVYF